jgi:hypothetical protein
MVMQVVRGGPAFAVSLVLSTVEPALRATAELGAWQVISPASAVGALLCLAVGCMFCCMVCCMSCCCAGHLARERRRCAALHKPAMSCAVRFSHLCSTSACHCHFIKCKH